MRALACVMILTGVAHADVPVVEADDAIAAVVTALAKPDAKATAGTAKKLAWVEKITDVKATEKAWRAAIAAAKLTILWEEVDDGTVAFTVEGASKARASVSASLWNGSIYVTAKPVIGTKLPGKCVVPPVVQHDVNLHSSGVDQRGESHSNTRARTSQTARHLDVDGDGIPDAFVPVPPTRTSCPDEIPNRVYVMRGACGHDVGVVGPGSFDVNAGAVPLDASGLRPLTIPQEKTRLSSSTTPVPGGPVPEMITTTRTFAMTKGAYAKTSETTRSGLCHHCATWYCTKR